ncbi:MAG: hypothetical protein ABI759_27070 [Candidatus Solibacter sp.]
MAIQNQAVQSTYRSSNSDPVPSRTAALVLSVVVLLLFATACSSGPQGPQPGTPGFFWAAAKETWSAGDYVKTSEHLQRILATDNEFSARARAWDVVISAGLAQAYIELADVYEAGARANRNNPTPFRKEVSTLRSVASSTAIQYTEDMHKFLAANKETEVLLAFAFPAGAVTQPAALKRISGGIVIQDSERELLQKAMMQRGVLLSVCAAVGVPDDSAAAQEKMKGGEVKLPRDMFLLAAARSMQSQSDLFTGNKLDQPARLKMMSEEALEVVKAVTASKETKAIEDKIRARMKKANIT